MIGKTLAHYEIIGLLGKGGMGEVYRAKDTKLGREVALKILPSEMSQDAERLARFDREARTLATLQHPNVASAYGFEDTPEARFLVMELVEGEGLDQRLARGAIPVAEARKIAAQIANGLEAAHEKGIVHRDLKPANIRLGPDGTVKVLDFGLAKAWTGGNEEIDLANSPTMTTHATLQGVILGTAGYMSPEQARGQEVDKRTDIWAFGVILWEMLTGQRLFDGTTVSDVMAGVLRAEISQSQLPADTPAPIRRLLRRCLEREAKQRLRDIGDAALELNETEVEGAPQVTVSGSRKRVGWPTVIAYLLMGALIATWFVTRDATDTPAELPLVRFEPKTFDEKAVFNARFLPNDQGIVFSGAYQGNEPELLHISATAIAPRRIGPAGTTLLSVSATGELAVLIDAKYNNHRVLTGTLARMTLDGAPRALIEDVREADWAPDDEMAIVRRVSGIDQLEYPSGNVLYQTSGYVSDARVSPDGKQVAFLDHQWWQDDRGRLKLVDESGQIKTLSEEYWAIEGVAWAPDGQSILFSGPISDITLSVLAVDLADGKVRSVLGSPVSLTVLDVDRMGRLLVIDENSIHGVVAHPAGGDREVDLTWLDSTWGPILAPDNKTVFFTNGRGGPNYTVVSRTVDGSPLTTLGEGDSQNLSPDGKWITAKVATPPALMLYPTGTGSARRLESGPLVQYLDSQWFPDSRHVFLTAIGAEGIVQCYRQAIDGGPPELLKVQSAASYSLLTLDGQAVLGQADDLKWYLYPLSGEEPRLLTGLRYNDTVLAWNAAGTTIYLTEQNLIPATIIGVDLATGERAEAFTLGRGPSPGLLWLNFKGRIMDPAQGYAYGYYKVLSQIYVVHNARW